MKIAMILAAALALCGCATSFTGSAHVPNGVEGCKRQCASQGLEFGGMVYLGEYSSACVCEAPDKAGEAPGISASTAAAVGVVSQMRAARARQQHGH